MEVKKILSELIESEEKQFPLSDEILTDMLQQKGYNIARRTVAKYRELLNIPLIRKSILSKIDIPKGTTIDEDMLIMKKLINVTITIVKMRLKKYYF